MNGYLTTRSLFIQKIMERMSAVKISLFCNEMNEGKSEFRANSCSGKSKDQDGKLAFEKDCSLNLILEAKKLQRQGKRSQIGIRLNYYFNSHF